MSSEKIFRFKNYQKPSFDEIANYIGPETFRAQILQIVSKFPRMLKEFSYDRVIIEIKDFQMDELSELETLVTEIRAKNLVSQPSHDKIASVTSLTKSLSKDSKK